MIVPRYQGAPPDHRADNEEFDAQLVETVAALGYYNLPTEFKGGGKKDDEVSTLKTEL